ncbi:MAG: hypothetical protein KAS71_12510 [Bacteroidales bacterium]|nr:hypothetical protein [Bacteroidales bacterium]
MKKILTFALSLLFVTTIVAQNGQEPRNNQSSDSPRMWIGGGVAFGNLSSRDFTVAPNFGMLIKDNIGFGGTIFLSSGNNSSAWDLQPYIRYYIPVDDRISFFGDGFVGIGGGDIITGVDGGEYSTLDFGARAGIQYWFTQRWSMTASNNVLVYNSIDGAGDFGMGLDFSSLNFSFFFHF